MFELVQPSSIKRPEFRLTPDKPPTHTVKLTRWRLLPREECWLGDVTFICFCRFVGHRLNVYYGGSILHFSKKTGEPYAGSKPSNPNYCLSVDPESIRSYES